ncbi:hypothetical protein A0130_06105 [Leifsonia xyli]|uniref:hypothetical protein n=1 Tax=Leifsonia xyli TaxID=1575 RepID=UPI0007CDE279|nr:hypothetical protein A0130_06105 [Leifsonia xyli]
MTDATDDRIEPIADAQPTEPTEPQQEQQLPGQQLPDAQPFTEPERVARGLALALLVIPAGVIVWTILWSIGFIASIVSWGVAVGAVWLYRRGSKARVTRGAFWGIIAIVVVTVVLSLLAGIFTDVVAAVGIPFTEALTNSKFWDVYFDNVFNNGDMWQAYLPQVLLALLFAALGCFMTLRRLARESRG